MLATTAARPLYHADLWGHLAYGRFILERGSLPATEPLMPLSHARFVDFAWLAQVVGFTAYRVAGPEGLRLLGGLLVGVAVGLIGAAARRRGGGVGGGWAAGALFLAAAWMQLFALPPWLDPLGAQMFRPQTVGVVLLAFVAAATPLPARPGWRWWALPAAFLVWANAHGSWPVGLAWLGLSAADRPVRLLFRAGPRTVFRSRRVRTGAGLTAACAAAVCVNPYGPAVWRELGGFAGHPNLADVIEWRPLTFASVQGKAFAVIAVGLAALLWRSPRRVRAEEAAMLVGFGVAAVLVSRWTLWWAVAAAVSMGRRVRLKVPERRTASARASGCLGGLLIGVLSAPPLWRLAGGETAGRGALAAGTPVAAAAFLRDRGTGGLVFNDHAFGDYLLFAAPGARPFIASHAHLIPPAVWEDAKRISAAGFGWEAELGRYGVNTLVLSPRRQPRLVAAARASARWREAWVDRTALVFERVTRPPPGPRPTAVRTPTAATVAAPTVSTPAPSRAPGPPGRRRR